MALAMKEWKMLHPVTYWTWAIVAGVAFLAVWYLMLMTLGAF